MFAKMADFVPRKIASKDESEKARRILKGISAKKKKFPDTNEHLSKPITFFKEHINDVIGVIISN